MQRKQGIIWMCWQKFQGMGMRNIVDKDQPRNAPIFQCDSLRFGETEDVAARLTTLIKKLEDLILSKSKAVELKNKWKKYIKNSGVLLFTLLFNFTLN